MVRRKTTSKKNISVFASPGKVLMIENNKGFRSSSKTPKSRNNSLITSEIIQNDSINSTAHKPCVKSKKRVSHMLRAIKEIRKFQASTKSLIPRASFSRVVREIAQNILNKSDIRFTLLSLTALQEATEMAIVNLFEIANLCCTHAKRVTLTPADIQLTRRAFGISNPLNA